MGVKETIDAHPFQGLSVFFFHYSILIGLNFMIDSIIPCHINFLLIITIN